MMKSQSTRLVTVCGLGSTWGAFTLGPILRQVTEDFAWSLSRFDGVVASAHHLMVGDWVDPNLGEPAPDSETARPRVQFIIPHALPADSLVREVAAQQGTPLCLTGRLDVLRKDFSFALNLWDTASSNLLYCAAEDGEVATLLDSLTNQAGRIAWALGTVHSVDAGVSSARSSFGTRSWTAYEAYASATEKLRNVAVQPGGARVTDVLRLLCAALAADGDYAAPRLLLLEHAGQKLAERDTEYAELLVDQLNSLPNDRLVYGLLRFESLVVLGKRAAASKLLLGLRGRFPGAPALEGAEGRLRDGAR